MKPFILKKLTEKQLDDKVKSLLDRNANVWFSQKRNPTGELEFELRWFFGNMLEIDSISVSKFNRFIRREGYLKTFKQENTELSRINESVASAFIQYILKSLGANPSEVSFKNRSKSPINHFQMETYFGTLYLSSVFVYVDDKNNIVAERTNASISNSDSYIDVCQIKFIN
jgi:hypothetical protein